MRALIDLLVAFVVAFLIVFVLSVSNVHADYKVPVQQNNNTVLVSISDMQSIIANGNAYLVSITPIYLDDIGETATTLGERYKVNKIEGNWLVFTNDIGVSHMVEFLFTYNTYANHSLYFYIEIE